MKNPKRSSKDELPRPYMPTPEQYAASIDAPSEEKGSVAKRLGKAIVWLVVIAAISILVYAGYLVVNVAKISTNPFSLQGLEQDATGRTNVLVLGVGDPGHAGEKLSDSLMVLSLDSSTKRIAQISLPRDLRVQIPGYGSNKINAANALGGPKLAMRTVSDTLGIPISYYVETNFSGLKDLVDAVDGIDVDVKERLRDTEYPCEDDQYTVCGLDIPVGMQHMDGTRALQYARCRKGTCGNDFGRAARQQEVMNLVRDKLMSRDTLLEPARLAQVVTALRAGVSTDMTALQMAQFGLHWQESKAHEPVSLVLSTDAEGGLRNAAGTSDLIPVGGDFSAIAERVQKIFMR